MLVKKKPNRKDFGYELPNFVEGKPGGWLIEGGQEAFSKALDEYETTAVKLIVTFELDSYVELNMPVSIQIEQFAGKNRYGFLDEDSCCGPDMSFSISNENLERQRFDVEESVMRFQNQFAGKKIHFLILPIEHL
jgi:hypothetical protein